MARISLRGWPTWVWLPDARSGQSLAYKARGAGQELVHVLPQRELTEREHYVPGPAGLGNGSPGNPGRKLQRGLGREDLLAGSSAVSSEGPLH